MIENCCSARAFKHAASQPRYYEYTRSKEYNVCPVIQLNSRATRVFIGDARTLRADNGGVARSKRSHSRSSYKKSHSFSNNSILIHWWFEDGRLWSAQSHRHQTRGGGVFFRTIITQNTANNTKNPDNQLKAISIRLFCNDNSMYCFSLRMCIFCV